MSPCGLLLHVPGLGARNAQLNAVRVFKALPSNIDSTHLLTRSPPSSFFLLSHSHIRDNGSLNTTLAMSLLPVHIKGCPSLQDAA